MAASKVDRCSGCGRRIKRSNPANARYWLLLHALSEKLPVRGQVYSAEAWHHWAKSKWLGADDLRLPNGKTTVIPRSTANLDVAAFNEYMGRVEAWANEHDVYLDELWEQTA